MNSPSSAERVTLRKAYFAGVATTGATIGSAGFSAGTTTTGAGAGVSAGFGVSEVMLSFVM